MGKEGKLSEGTVNFSREIEKNKKNQIEMAY